MKNAIILHGMPSKEDYYNPLGQNESDAHWISWLQHQLMIRDIYAATPEMPLAFKPDYTVWKKEFERYDIGPETILVGHSCGAGFLVRWLSENKSTKVGKVVLVAPWINVNREEDIQFFEGMTIDENIASRTEELIVFESTNDMVEIQDSVSKLKTTLKNARFRQFTDYGHFCYRDINTNEFPELLQEIVG
jgi:predicted alpha/beta hydrolase family esterase